MNITTYTLRNGELPVSAKHLAKALNIRLENIYTSDNPPVEEPLINWGRKNKVLGAINGAPTVNKLEALKTFRREGIRCPNVMELGDEFIVRKFRHYQGRDILEGNKAFLVQKIRKSAEVRLDVYERSPGDFRCFRLHTKTPHQDTGFVWNRNNVAWATVGYRSMRDTLGENFNEVISLAKSAVKSLGYNFGAVDIIRNEDDGLWYALEVNKAPNLGEVGARSYARRLTQ